MKSNFLLFILLIGSPFLFILYSFDGVISSSHKGGIYSDDIELSFTAISAVDIYYHFEESMDKNDTRYIYPLSLTAMSGESRKYTLVVTALDENEIIETRTIEYTIDKDIPGPPVLNKKDGLYNSAITLEFSKNEADIYYSIQSGGQNNFNLWLGESLDIQQNDVLNTEIIQSYCEDSVGNRSSVKINSFTILPSVEKHQSLEVLSPVEGIFLNNQLIYIDTTGYKWTRYSFNDIDPATRGTSYINPILLKTPGDYKLNIAALPFNSEKVLTREIVFSIVDNQNIIINKESGIFTEDIALKFNKSGMNYNLEERAVVSWDSVLPDTLNLMPVPGVVKYRSLRIGNPGEKGEYRYFFILDKRIPAAPLISVASDSPIASNTEVRILGVPGADIFFTLDGSRPDRYSAYYKRPFAMEIPEGRSSGSMLIKAIAYFSDKSTSIVTSKLITFDLKKPEKPELTITKAILNQTGFNITNNSSNRIIYTVRYDGSEPEEPVSSSFTGVENMIVGSPHGIQTDVRIKVAFIDRAGNISESVLVDLLKTDTVPPEGPEFIFSDKTLTLTGNETIHYKIIANNDIDSGEYQLYKNPISLDFKDSTYLSIVISAFSVDDCENKSSIVNSNEIKIDSRIPVLPDYSGISNGEIYNNPRSLRFHTSDDIQVYYTVSENLTPPEDPIPGDSNKINEYLYFDCPVNETSQYAVKLVASYNNGETVSLPELISFEIDRIAPRAPVITSVLNGSIYNDDVKISVNEEEDKIWILIKDHITVENLNFPYFEANGILINKDYLIRQEEKSEKKYQLAALSIDPAGNTNISREIIHFSIDKIPPEPPEIKVDDSLSEYLVVRMTSGDPDKIIYEISYDDSYPEKPTIDSLLYQLPLQIQNINTTSIYISARTIDTAGNLSDSTAIRKILFDNSDLQTPTIHIGRLNSTETSISFASLTGRKIYIKEGDGSFQEFIKPLIIDLRSRDYVDLFYYSMNDAGDKSSVAVSRVEKTSSSGNIITGIGNNKIYNTGRVVWKSNESRVVRYEVAIDDELPKKVTVFSPELTEPIVFDAAEGETLRVTMNVKEFINDLPVMEKYDKNFSFTIDKTKPLLPVLQGVEDGGFFQTDRTFKFKSEESVYYKVSSDSNDLNYLDFIRYDKPIEISVAEGKYEQFTIESYSKDSAGNQSEIKIVEFTIDKANIYVSSKGKDSNDGTRFRPFKTLERALEYSNQTERKVINLAEGEFMLESTLILKKEINIIGGFSPEKWTTGTGQTIINISGRLSGNSSMVNVYSGNISLKRITLSNINLNAPMITMSGGTLLLNEVKLLHANSKTPVSLEINDSDLTIIDTELIFGPITNGNLINVKNSRIFFNNTNIKGTGNSDILKILSLEKTKAQITNSGIMPSSGQKIELISANNSELEIDSSYFDTGSASINTNLFIIKNSDLKMRKIEVGSISQSRILSGFDIIDSTIAIEECKFNLKAVSGISFIRIINSSLELSDTEINAEKTVEFLYLLKGKTSITSFENSIISTNTTDIFTGFELSNSVSLFRDNVMYFSGGTTIFSAFTFQKPLNIEVISNKLLSSNISWISSENQVAFNIIGVKDNVVIRGNNIYGWESVLRHNDKLLRSIDELNNYRGFQDIPENNYSRAD